MAAQTLFQSKVGFFRAKLQQLLYGALLTLLVVLQAAAVRAVRCCGHAAVLCRCWHGAAVAQQAAGGSCRCALTHALQ